MDVDDDDVYMIQQLILGYQDVLDRNSWEWFLKDELEDDMERFVEDPYDFVISYNWPGGIVIPELKTEDITIDYDKYFGFRTTKEGDIIGIGEEEVTTNDWVCGNGYYFQNGSLTARSYEFSTSRSKIEKGSIINFDVYVDNPKELLSFELPIYFNNNGLELNSINFSDGFFPKWNFRSSLNLLTLLDFSKDQTPLKISGGKLFSFSILANEDINNPTLLINSNADRKIEAIGMDEKIADIGLRIEIVNIIPTNLQSEIRYDGSQPTLFISSPIDQVVAIQLTASDGTILEKKEFSISRGENLYSIDSNLPPGIFYITLKNASELTTLKIVISE